MKYNLINATNKDTDYIKKSKLYNIFTYADDEIYIPLIVIDTNEVNE